MKKTNTLRSDKKPKTMGQPTPNADNPSQSAWSCFWFAHTDPVGFHAIRVLAGTLFIFWLLSFLGRQEAFFGLEGWYDQQAYQETVEMPGGSPVPLGWSVLYIAGSSSAMLQIIYWSAILILALFTLGYWTRITSVLTWIIVASFTANPAILYSADSLLIVLAFYLMVGYVVYGQWSHPQTTLSRWTGTKDTWLIGGSTRDEDGSTQTGSSGANIALRLMQIHFALIFVVSGLHKLQFGPWWGGTALWYPQHPAFETDFMSVRKAMGEPQADPFGNIVGPQFNFYLFYTSLAQYLMLAWQLAFPAFAWRTGRWRWLLLGGAAIGWAGLVFLYREPMFGPIYLIGCLSFLTPREWRGMLGRIKGVLPRGKREAKAAEEANLTAART